MAGGTDSRRLEHVSELPPDLPRLRTLETYLRLQLARVEQQIRHLEDQARASTPSPAPDRPAWLAEYDISAQHRLFQIHVGDCRMAGHRVKPIDEAAARRGCVEAGACQFCRPDTALGVLD
jgi:hypothetical protein